MAKKKRNWLKFHWGKKARKPKGSIDLLKVLQVIGGFALLAGVATGFVFVDRYVKDEIAVSERTGQIKLVNPPVWLNEELKNKILAAATANDEDLKLDDDGAMNLCENIAMGSSWLTDVKVQTTSELFNVSARWRKPLGKVEAGSRQVYVDNELVVMECLNIPELPIVEIAGLQSLRDIPDAGAKWQCDDLAAAIVILDKLSKMDDSVSVEKPLLFKIARIDVSNYSGRKNAKGPHIVFYCQDDTEILWGAEYGTWQRHLEASDTEKLARLYKHYKEHNHEMGNVKYINLMEPDRFVGPGR